LYWLTDVVFKARKAERELALGLLFYRRERVANVGCRQWKPRVPESSFLSS
jgi:hypothetical protein